MVTDICSHETDVCLPCLVKSFGTDLNSKRADQLKCPSRPHLLGYQVVKAFVDSQTFAMYDLVLRHIKRNKASQMNLRYERYTLASWTKTTHSHTCRVETCQSGGQYESTMDTCVIYPNCGGLACVDCDADFTDTHRNAPCAQMAPDQAAAKSAQEVASANSTDKRTKGCPTQSKSGCDQMTSN